jgi:hypothetical protein
MCSVDETVSKNLVVVLVEGTGDSDIWSDGIGLKSGDERLSPVWGENLCVVIHLRGIRETDERE